MGLDVLWDTGYGDHFMRKLLFWTQGRWEVEGTEAGDNQLELLSVWCCWSLHGISTKAEVCAAALLSGTMNAVSLQQHHICTIALRTSNHPWLERQRPQHHCGIEIAPGPFTFIPLRNLAHLETIPSWQVLYPLFHATSLLAHHEAKFDKQTVGVRSSQYRV